jgi:hypothetical protein
MIRDCLTPRNRVALKKLIVTHLVKKFPAFYGTQNFTTIFTRARQSTLLYPVSLRSILILSSHLCLDLSHGLFPSSFPSKILNIFLIVCMCATCPAHLTLLNLVTMLIFGEQCSKFSLSIFPRPPVTFSLLGPTYLLSPLFSNTLILYTSPRILDQVSHPYRIIL